jgi:hypothetical protein
MLLAFNKKSIKEDVNASRSCYNSAVLTIQAKIKITFPLLREGRTSKIIEQV